MGVPNTLVDAVWVLVCIGPSMMCPMFTTPPANGALYSTSTDTGEEDFQGQASVVVGQSALIIIEDMMRGCLRFV